MDNENRCTYVRCCDGTLVLVGHVSGSIVEMMNPTHGSIVLSGRHIDIRFRCKHLVLVKGQRGFCTLSKDWVKYTHWSLRCSYNWQLCQYRKEN